MRILCTFSGGSGHLEPLLPLARASRAAGHEVAFAARPWMVPVVEGRGFRCFRSGTDVGLVPVTRPLLEVDMERELRDLRDGFGRRIARERATDLVPICEAWRPDVVVWDETDFGAPIVAERLGVPHASFVVIAAGSFVRAEIMAEALDEVRREHGLAPDPAAEMLQRQLVIDPVPPTFRDPALPAPGTRHGMRPWLDGEAPLRAPRDASPPRWVTAVPGAPLVYLTLGTVFNHESGDLFARAITGVRSLRANVLVTVGREIDPASLGRQPSNVTVERFVPQAEVLPWTDLVVSHGGSGSVLGAIAHGVPLVVLPMGADQPLNAGRIVDLGLGKSLDPVRVTPDEIAAAALETLGDRACAATVRALRAEMAALPPPEVAVARLEVLDRRQ